MARNPADHAGLEVLPFDRCLQLLAMVPVGRISFIADGEIVVLPVNHLMDGQDPVFLTARGSKLSAAEGQNVVAFEADEYDERTRSGWSVLVNGRACAIYDDAEIRRLNALDLYPWPTTADRPFWIRIRPTSVSGRQTPPDGPGCQPLDLPAGAGSDWLPDRAGAGARLRAAAAAGGGLARVALAGIAPRSKAVLDA
jgi:uncharacterized protein